jgi:uncharacterized protein YprB with RNaseH-like and TPR domain
MQRQPQGQRRDKTAAFKGSSIMPAADLRSRLQRLRAHKQPAPQPPPVAPRPTPLPHSAPAAPNELPGQRITAGQGAFQLIETRYPLNQAHGPRTLAEAFAHDPATAARLARDEALGRADPRALAFIDTETTGLAGGAGTLVFLIGVGVCEAEDFVVRQYFLSEPAHERALWQALLTDLAPRAGWITFNGKAFDLPLIESRLTMTRQRGALGQRPHLDLLMPARRLYRGRLPSCALGDIERGVFKIAREDDDVPGWLIPQLYNDYLRTGNPREMRRVIYHNTVDILSMVTLTAHLLETFATPLEVKQPLQSTGRKTVDEGRTGAGQRLAGGRRSQERPRAGLVVSRPGQASRADPAAEDLLRLGCWHDDQDRPDEAEAAFRRALGGALTLPDRALGLTRLAALLKRQARRAEAVPLWEQLASFSVNDSAPFVELAKYYEWHGGDLRRAEAWTQRALALVGSLPGGWQRDLSVAELSQRLERVRAKLARSS